MRGTISEQFERYISTVAETAHARAMRGGFTGPVYLYHKPSSGGAWGELVLSDAAPDDFELSAEDRCPINSMTNTRLRAWIQARARGAPILPTASP